jgi:hypothetical protein
MRRQRKNRLFERKSGHCRVWKVNLLKKQHKNRRFEQKRKPSNLLGNFS